MHDGSKYALWRKEVPFGGPHNGRQHFGVQIPQKLENGRLSDRYHIWMILGVSYRIVSATVVSADITCITAGSSTVDGSHYTRWSKGVQATSHPPARTRACCIMVHDTGEGWRGGRRKDIVTWYRHPRDTKTAQYWSWPPSRHTPSTSRKW